MKNTPCADVRTRPRILAVVRWPVGGIRTWCRYVYRHSALNAFDIEVIVPDIEEARHLVEDLRDTEVRTTLVNGGSTMGFGRSVVNRIVRNSYALVHSHGFTSGVASSLARAVRRTPHLITQHDVVLKDQYRDFWGRCGRLAIGMMLRDAAAVQSVSHAAAANLKEAFPAVFSNGRSVTVIRNGIESSRFLEAEPEDIRALCGVPDRAIVVGFFGRFMAQKGFRYLVEAIANYEKSRTNELPLFVLAVGGGGYRREEQSRIASLGLASYFRFIDFTPNVAGLIKGVDVVVMPSLWEACGLLAMEALVAGTPLVVSSCDALREVVDGSPAVVVPMRYPQALLHAIIELGFSACKPKFEQFGRIAAQRFDAEQTAHGIADLYSRLTRDMTVTA
jgi:glycosyltransferase involved in cell wall biosynthesis